MSEIKSMLYIAEGPGVFVKLCGRGRVYTSPDVEVWTERTVCGGPWVGIEFLEDEELGPVFEMTNENGARVTSPDGITWTTRFPREE